MFVDEAQLGRDLGVEHAVVELEIPAALLLGGPTVADGAVRHPRLAGEGVPHQELPLTVLAVAVARQTTRAEVLARLPVAYLDEERQIGVLLGVLLEVVDLPVAVELGEQDVVHRQPEGGILAGVAGNPPVGVLGDLGEVGAEDRELRSCVADLGDEVGVGRTGHVEVGAHDRDETGVVPVGRFVHVGLLAPDLRRGGREIAVPVVEAEDDAADQRHESTAGRVTDLGHRRDRREPGHAVGAVFGDGVDHRCGAHLECLVPADPPEAALAPRLLVTLAPLRCVLDARPRLDRVAEVLLLGRAVHVDQHAAGVGVLHSNRRVQVPRVRDPPLAPARLVRRQTLLELGVVGGLEFPGDDAVLDEHLPRAAPRAVDAVRRPDTLVVLEAIPVEVLPFPCGRIDLLAAPTLHRLLLNVCT